MNRFDIAAERIFVEDRKVRELAGFEAPELAFEPQHIGCIDRDRAKCPLHSDTFARRLDRRSIGGDSIYRDPDRRQRMYRRHHEREVGMQRKNNPLALERAQARGRLGAVGPKSVLAMKLASIVDEIWIDAGQAAERLQPSGLVGRADAVMLDGEAMVEARMD